MIDFGVFGSAGYHLWEVPFFFLIAVFGTWRVL